MRKIDAFPHILPRAVLQRMSDVASGAAKHWLDGTWPLTGLFDMDVRFRAMDQLDDYVQVLTLATPPIEQVAAGRAGQDIATLANDAMAELCGRHPDRFAGFAAGLPMDDVDASMRELERAVNQLGALGVQIFTNANGHALDEQRFEPLWGKLAELDVAVWVHGARSFTLPEFEGDDESMFGLWLGLGWPYEMGLFMARLALRGTFIRYPNLRILTHHGGGMIPTFGQRAGGAAISYTGPAHQHEQKIVDELPQRPIDYLKMFYADTTISASKRQVGDKVERFGLDQLRAAVNFFGIDHVLFGSDMPFGQNQSGFLPLAADFVDQLDLTPAQQELLFAGNARRVLKVAR